MERVSGLVREEISRLLSTELRDPRMRQLLTVSHVDVSADLRHATVSITVLGNEQAQAEAMAGLGSAVGFLRRGLGQRLQLKHTPELRFVLDASIRNGDHVLALLDGIRQEEGSPDG